MRTSLLLALASFTTACAMESTSATQSEVNVNTKDEVFSKDFIRNLQERTHKFRKVENALAAGYIEFSPECFAEEEDGELHSVGVFYDYPPAIDDVLDPNQPESLLYAPNPDGSLDLTGVEFWIPFDLWTSSEAPTIEGVPLNYEEDMGVWGLHVWIWRENPEGITAESNPNVSCP